MKIYLVIWSECDSGYDILGAFRQEADAIKFADQDHKRPWSPGKTITRYKEDIAIEEVELQ